MKNYRRLAARLQRALILKGHTIKLNTRQFYSEQQNRFITYYILTEGNADLLKTCSLPEVVKCLAAMYEDVN